MVTNTLTVVEATKITVSAAAQNCNLSTNWYLSFREQHAMQLPSDAGVGMARVAQFILGQTDIRKCVPLLLDRDNVL